LTCDGAQTFAIRSCEILTDETPLLYPSDHYSVLAALELT